MKSLELIKQDLLTLNSKLVETEGELSIALEQELEQVKKDLSIKGDHYGYRIDRLEASIEFWDKKVKEYQAVKKTIENHLNRMKDNIKFTMVSLDTSIITGEEYQFKIRPSSKPKVIVSKDIRDLPAKYVIHVTAAQADLDLLREDLKNGLKIDNVSLEYGTTLTIRPKKDI